MADEWKELFENTPHFKNLRAAHATMPGWTIVEEDIDLMRKLVDPSCPWYMTKQDSIYPVIRWRTGEDGKKTIILEPLPDELQTELQIGIQDKPESYKLSPLMGLVLIAAYSPEQTAGWPEEDGFSRSDSSRTNAITSIQVPGFVAREVARAQAGPIDHNRDIQLSPLLTLMDAHIRQNTNN